MKIYTEEKQNDYDSLPTYVCKLEIDRTGEERPILHRPTKKDLDALRKRASLGQPLFPVSSLRG